MDNFTLFVDSISNIVCNKLQCRREKSAFKGDLHVYFPSVNWHFCIAEENMRKYYEQYTLTKDVYKTDTIDMISHILINEIQDKFNKDLFFSQMPFKE